MLVVSLINIIWNSTLWSGGFYFILYIYLLIFIIYLVVLGLSCGLPAP